MGSTLGVSTVKVATPERMQLTVLTYNVWFDRFASSTRQAALFDLIETLSPDVICLQEVTPVFISRLSSSPPKWFSAYVASDTAWVAAGSGYGTLTLARVALVPSFTRIALPTYMGRDLLLTRLAVPGAGGAAVIGNVHLESLGNADLRARQLAECAPHLCRSASSLALLCGDFNFCSWANFNELPKEHPATLAKPAASGRSAAAGSGDSYRSQSAISRSHPPALPLHRPPHAPPLENACLQKLLPGWLDAWAALHPTDHGFTFDTEANAMLAASSHGYERMRYDRILVRLPPPSPLSAVGSGLQPSECEGAGGRARASEEGGRGDSCTSDVAAAGPLGPQSAEAASDSDAANSALVWGIAGTRIVGSDPLPASGGRPVLISDHFGLLVTLRAKVRTTSGEAMEGRKADTAGCETYATA